MQLVLLFCNLYQTLQGKVPTDAVDSDKVLPYDYA